MKAIAILLMLFAVSPLAAQDAAPVAQAGDVQPLTDSGNKLEAIVKRHLEARYGEALEPENRWELVARMAAMLDEAVARRSDDDEVPVVFASLLEVGTENWSAAHRQRAREAINRLDEEGLFHLLDELAAVNHFVRPLKLEKVGDVMGGASFGYSSAFRRITRACSVRMAMAADAGDGEGIARAFEHILTIARISSHEPFLVGHIISDAVLMQGLSRAREYAMSEDADAPDLRRMIAVMDRQLPRIAMPMVFEGERVLARDFVEAVYTHPNRSALEMIILMTEVDLDEGERVEAKAVIDAAGGLLTHEEARELVEESYDRVIGLARELDRDSLESAAVLERELEDQRLRAFFLTNLMYPAIAAGLEGRAATEAMAIGTRAMLAIELFRRERGEYPEMLEELAPEYLDAVPLDLYTGEPLRYRRLDPQDDEHGRGYILYSVGRDGEDNGGRVHEHGSYPATTRKGAGFDMVINRSEP